MTEETRLDVAATEGSGGELPVRPGVPWWTVVSLAALMAFADGFWMMSLRGAVGAIERTQGPFASWLRESSATVPVFAVAVLAALALALRWFGPVLAKPRTIVATWLLIAAAGTLAGVGELAVSSMWDYQLQLQLMNSLHHMASATVLPLEGQASLNLQLGAIGYGSGILLITNLVLIGWAVALRGGRLDVSRLRRRLPWGARTDYRRLFLAAALAGSAAIHAAVSPEHLDHWAAAGAFFLLLAAAELVLGILLLRGRRDRALLLATAAISAVPLVLWLYSRTVGLPFGPESGVPETVGLPDCAASALELGTLLVAVALLHRRDPRPGRTAGSAHSRALPVAAAIAISVLGLLGTNTAWFQSPDSSVNESVHAQH